MITRENYESFFLLYMDNELSGGERHMVEAFVDQNPDLNAEFQSFRHCRLAPEESIVFGNKASLYKQEEESAAQEASSTQQHDISGQQQDMPGHRPIIDVQNYQTRLLDYIDGELPEQEGKALETFIATNPALHAELELLRQTQSIADTNIVFPDKSLLYKTEKRALLMPLWLRSAAAAAILLGIGLYFIVTRNTGTGNSIADAHSRSGDTKISSRSVTPEAGDTSNKTVPQVIQSEENRAPENKGLAMKDAHKIDLSNKMTTKKNIPGNTGSTDAAGNKNQGSVTNDLAKRDGTTIDQARIPEGSIQVAAIGNTKTGDESTGDRKTRVRIPGEGTSATGQTQDLAVKIPAIDLAQNDKGKTSGSTISKENSSFATQALLNNGSDDVAMEQTQSAKKHKLRGLFRRVTRTFEKTANVDDDKQGLLIGNLQFALK